MDRPPNDHAPATGPRRGGRRGHLRLAVALPFVTGLLALCIAVSAYQVGRTDATAGMTTRDAAVVWASPPGSWVWLLMLTTFGALIGLAIAVAFTRQLRTLARRTEFLARRNFSFPVELEADGEVAPLVSAINELLQSVRDYARHSVADGMISFSRAGRVLSINTRAAVALGVDAAAIIGASFRELVPDVEANSEIVDALLLSLERSEPFDLQGLTWVNTRGQRLRVDLQGTVLAGDESIISVLVVFERADMERVQRQVGRAHRLMVIGGFASELAHEIRNPLSSVFGLVDLLHERLPTDDPGHRHLEVLTRAAERIERLVRQLLDLVPTEIHDLESCDLNRLVRRSVEMVEAGNGADALRVVQDLEEPLPACRVDPDRVERVLENLLRNAFAHTPADGRIDVRTHAEEAEVVIVVSNTGSFIALEDRERIFQPFVSGRGNGTGLGLAIAQQIAFAHGGSLDVESTVDSGTSFALRLPMDPAAADEVEISSPHFLAGAA